MLHCTDIIIFAPLLLNSKKPIEVSEHCYLQVKKEYCNQMKITKINIKIKETWFRPLLILCKNELYNAPTVHITCTQLNTCTF